MSRAFVKEDIDLPERSTRLRSVSGLPPGAVNYLTAQGADRLRERLADLRRAGADQDEIQALEETLQSATVVQPLRTADVVVFGVAVTLQNPSGEWRTYRVVGVDEVALDAENVSWVSPLGKTLLGATLNQRLTLPADNEAWWRVVKLAYEPAGSNAFESR